MQLTNEIIVNLSSNWIFFNEKKTFLLCLLEIRSSKINKNNNKSCWQGYGETGPHMGSAGWRKIWHNFSPVQFGDIFHKSLKHVRPLAQQSTSRKFILRN